MNIYFDTEFHEYEKDVMVGDSIDPISTTVPTIELISIGMVAEDGREYYAICKEFDVEAAWNANQGTIDEPNFWLRDNVLKSIFNDLTDNMDSDIPGTFDFTLANLTYFVSLGKTREQIAKEIIEFANEKVEVTYKEFKDGKPNEVISVDSSIQFYAYYADYDWVVLCWLFGRMIDLPRGFPMYCKDLKQEFDRLTDNLWWRIHTINEDSRLRFGNEIDQVITSKEEMIKVIKAGKSYPKQDNCHNALDDAKWNKKLMDFLKTF